MKAPLRLAILTESQRSLLRRVEREFHERAFGEELARVNLDMTPEQRREYLGRMRELARKHGVPKPHHGFPFDGEDPEKWV
jgi:hypothetical protein